MNAVAMITPEPKNLANVKQMLGILRRGSFFADIGKSAPKLLDSVYFEATKHARGQNDKGGRDVQSQSAIKVIAAAADGGVGVEGDIRRISEVGAIS